MSSKYLSSKYLFGTKYNVYPSYEIGITKDVFNIGANLHLEYNTNIEFLLSYRSLLKGLSMGGGNNSIDGYYIGTRYKF